MKAFSATMSVCATKRIARPDRPMASSSASIRWSEGVEM